MAYRKLGRTSSQRKAMLRDLTTDLIINEAIVTTEARAKEIRKSVEKMITLGKRGDLHARRQAAAFVRNEVASQNFDEETGKYSETTALQKLFSELHHVMLSAMVDILVSLKLNHAVGCCANGNHRISIKSSILLSVMMMEGLNGYS